jgi:hypothetical protein
MYLAVLLPQVGRRIRNLLPSVVFRLVLNHVTTTVAVTGTNICVLLLLLLLLLQVG